ncbi:hypothetical protein GHT06_010724 [Daphnia sinensis]|uniref:Chitin-binding type-2 domain-containing protein n=1 Tax=Daphnia sinensis TaxID=1820382 RepID=A0AAD5PX79_9CRUS|nr:hypothetical protein GHT06_010724 [Daphnia sinensis]
MTFVIKYSMKNALICWLIFGIVQAKSDSINNVERKIEKHTERFYDKAGLCSEAGYKRNGTDATQFNRCVDYSGKGKNFVVFKFACPPALEFDEKLLICVLTKDAPMPTAVTFISNVQNFFSTALPSSPADPEADSLTLLPPPTSTSAVGGTDTLLESTSVRLPAVSFVPLTDSLQPVTLETSSPNSHDQVVEAIEKVVETTDIVRPTMEMDCSSQKFYRLPNSDCNRFYQCYLKSVSIFSCAPGLVFDEPTSRCSLPEESSCDQHVANPIVDALPDYFEMDCSSGVLRRYPFDCRNFYQCYDNGIAKSLLFYSCSAGLVFDEESSNCLHPYETSPCFANGDPSKSTPLDYHLQRLFLSLPNASTQ